MKGQVKSECVSWKCVCVCVAFCGSRFTSRSGQKWTRCVNQNGPTEALENKVESLLDEASPVHDVLHFLLSAVPQGRKGRGQERE